MKRDGKWWTKSLTLVSGCTPVSAGCDNCWARVMHTRFAKYHKAPPFSTIQLYPERLEEPLKWRKPQVVALNLSGDLFHKDVPFEFIDKVFAVMALCPQHTFLLLTKRPEGMADYLNLHGIGFRISQAAKRLHLPTCYAALARDSSGGPAGVAGVKGWPLANCWLGTSVEDQATADERIHELLKCPAAHRFVSLEPMLGPVDLDSEEADHVHALGCGNFDCECGDRGVDWVIVGSESGSKARAMDLDWVRSIRDQCRDAGVPVWFKQMMDGRQRVNMPELDGRVWDQMPEAVRAGSPLPEPT